MFKPDKISSRLSDVKSEGFSLEYIFKSGKCEGLSIKEAIDSDKKHIRYLIDNTDFLLDNIAFDYLCNAENDESLSYDEPFTMIERDVIQKRR